VTVPETSIDEDGNLILPKYKVGTAWQPPYMKSESESHCMEGRAHKKFWLSIFAANAAHVQSALRRCEDVYHLYGRVPRLASRLRLASTLAIESFTR
jgi:hypothetical protein